MGETNRELEATVKNIRHHTNGMKLIKTYEDGFNRKHSVTEGTFATESDKESFENGDEYSLDPKSDF